MATNKCFRLRENMFVAFCHQNDNVPTLKNGKMSIYKNGNEHMRFPPTPGVRKMVCQFFVYKIKKSWSPLSPGLCNPGNREAACHLIIFIPVKILILMSLLSLKECIRA